MVRQLFLLLALTSALPGPAHASSDRYVNWPAELPPVSAPYRMSSEAACDDACVHDFIARLGADASTLSASCDHDAAFAVLYHASLVTFETALHERGSFADPTWTKDLAGAFARRYFDAYGAWSAGDRRHVPPVWRVAFAAVDAKRVTALGNVMLGMNAHIQRDLPFALAGVGLVSRDGASRKPDHDASNRWLADAVGPATAQIVRTLDPTFGDLDVAGTEADDALRFQVVPLWRERAWRAAERLTHAHTREHRAAAARAIESRATTTARVIARQTGYRTTDEAARRDRYCNSRA